MDNETRLRIEKAWLKRAEFHKYKKGTKQYFNAQTEFFVGAMTALEEAVPSWYIQILRQDYVVNEEEHKMSTHESLQKDISDKG